MPRYPVKNRPSLTLCKQVACYQYGNDIESRQKSGHWRCMGEGRISTFDDGEYYIYDQPVLSCVDAQVLQ
jgi:hypothetical protein